MRPTSPLPRLVISELDHIPEREQALGAARLIMSATLIPALRSPLRLALVTLLGAAVMTIAVLAGRLPLSSATPTIAAALLLVIVVALLAPVRAWTFGRKRPGRDIWLATTTGGRVVGTAVVTSGRRGGVVTGVAPRPGADPD